MKFVNVRPVYNQLDIEEVKKVTEILDQLPISVRDAERLDNEIEGSVEISREYDVSPEDIEHEYRLAPTRDSNHLIYEDLENLDPEKVYLLYWHRGVEIGNKEGKPNWTITLESLGQ